MDIAGLKRLIEESKDGYKCKGIDQVMIDYDPSSEFEDFINHDLSFKGYRKNVKFGGYGQGDFFSYSSITFWLKGKNQYTQGGISVVKSCCIYISHLAPIVIFNYATTQWLNKSTCAPDLGWEGENIPLESEEPYSGWEIFDQELKERLALHGFKVINKKVLLQAGIENTELVYDLDFDISPNMLNALFYSGIDYSY